MSDAARSANLKGKVARHLVLPFAAPAALVGLYFTPKPVFGCANRGVMALGVVFLSTVAAVAATWKGVSSRQRGDSEIANWWLLTTLILLLPIVLLFGPLG